MNKQTIKHAQEFRFCKISKKNDCFLNENMKFTILVSWLKLKDNKIVK